MNKERLMKVLLGPVVSEKSSLAGEINQFVFHVAPDATKPEIRSAVELLFDDVDVEAVQVVNQKGKRKNFGQIEGKRKDTKKAYVRLKEGQEIELFK